MKIIADENITAVRDFFTDCGELLTLPGRAITRQALMDADVLLVRSVTSVNRKLLENTGIKFVGSATSGIDHIDTHYLQDHGIGFSHAAGANANSVVEYVLCALAVLQQKSRLDWSSCSVGIIGAGNIGGLLSRRLASLAIPHLIHDPYLDNESVHASRLRCLNEVLEQDVITLHVPLTNSGDHPTAHMINRALLEALPSGRILVNTSRGGVVDNQALFSRLNADNRTAAVIDTWENEPDINLGLMQLAAITTPHIAGYSLDGKIAGTACLYRRFSEYFGLPERQESDGPLKGQVVGIALPDDSAGLTDMEIFGHILCRAYDIMGDHRRMSVIAQTDNPGLYFDRLRKEYPQRREFSHFRVDIRDRPQLGPLLSALGFTLQP